MASVTIAISPNGMNLVQSRPICIDSLVQPDAWGPAVVQIDLAQRTPRLKALTDIFLHAIRMQYC
jgi:hypothetical protein